MSAFRDIAASGAIRIWEGVLARTVEGEQLSLAVVELDPGSVVREHSHENEQLGLVVSAPARDDWQALERLPVQSPRWPQT